MRIVCYFIGWNIEQTVALTVKHYLQFCEKVVYLDNHSTDGSWNEALRAGAECQLFGKPGVLDDGEYIKVKNNIWKGTDYDYVIVCDDDEILYHPELSSILEAEKAGGTTIFKTQGYNMFSREMPKHNFLDIKTGLPCDNYSKQIIFDPKAITEIGYVYGAHQSKCRGRIQWSKATVSILHYRGIGGPERLIKRQASYIPRLSELNRRFGLGHHYVLPDSQKDIEWAEGYLNSHFLDVFGYDTDDKAK